jgi:transposase
MGKQKKWSASQKFEIALLALKNETTINDICRKYEVAPCQVYDWKKQLLENGAHLFEKKESSTKKTEIVELERKQEKLFEKIGELSVERDFLKKSLRKFRPDQDEN